VLAPLKETVTGMRSNATLGVMAVTLRTDMATCSGQAATTQGKQRRVNMVGSQSAKLVKTEGMGG
jgi:hypothetical protein